MVNNITTLLLSLCLYSNQLKLSLSCFLLFLLFLVLLFLLLFLLFLFLLFLLFPVFLIFFLLFIFFHFVLFSFLALYDRMVTTWYPTLCDGMFTAWYSTLVSFLVFSCFDCWEDLIIVLVKLLVISFNLPNSLTNLLIHLNYDSSCDRKSTTLFLEGLWFHDLRYNTKLVNQNSLNLRINFLLEWLKVNDYYLRELTLFFKLAAKALCPYGFLRMMVLVSLGVFDYVDERAFQFNLNVNWSLF